MLKDKKRKIIDNKNSDSVANIQEMLEIVLSTKLKPINEVLGMLENGQKNLQTSVLSLEAGQKELQKGFGGLEKEQKKQGKRIKKIQQTLDVAIKTFDRADAGLFKRVTRVEAHLGLPRLD